MCFIKQKDQNPDLRKENWNSKIIPETSCFSQITQKNKLLFYGTIIMIKPVGVRNDPIVLLLLLLLF